MWEASVPGSLLAGHGHFPAMCLHIVLLLHVSLCTNFPHLQGHQSYWIRATLMMSLNLITSPRPFSKQCFILKYWDLAFQYMNLGKVIIQHIDYLKNFCWINECMKADQLDKWISKMVLYILRILICQYDIHLFSPIYCSSLNLWCPTRTWFI